jgi:hypothetical protein
MPFILRGIGNWNGDEERFGLVGASYVHGVMDGELWRKVGEKKIKPVEGWWRGLLFLFKGTIILK